MRLKYGGRLRKVGNSVGGSTVKQDRWVWSGPNWYLVEAEIGSEVRKVERPQLRCLLGLRVSTTPSSKCSASDDAAVDGYFQYFIISTVTPQKDTVSVFHLLNCCCQSLQVSNLEIGRPSVDSLHSYCVRYCSRSTPSRGSVQQIGRQSLCQNSWQRHWPDQADRAVSCCSRAKSQAFGQVNARKSRYCLGIVHYGGILGDV